MYTLNTKEPRDWFDVFNLTEKRGEELFKQARKIFTDHIEKCFLETLKEDSKPSGSSLVTCIDEIMALAKTEDEQQYLIFNAGQMHLKTKEYCHKAEIKILMGKVFEF